MDYKVLFFDLLARISSRKFIVFAAVGLIILSDNFGIVIDPEIRKQLLVLSIAYLTAQTTVDAVKSYKA